MHVYVYNVCTYTYTSGNLFVPVSVYRCMHKYRVWIYTYIYIWQRPKNIGLVPSPGGLFATRLVTKSGGIATNPPCDKLVEDYSTLQQTPATRVGNRRGQPANPYFEALPYIYIYIHVNMSGLGLL